MLLSSHLADASSSLIQSQLRVSPPRRKFSGESLHTTVGYCVGESECIWTVGPTEGLEEGCCDAKEGESECVSTVGRTEGLEEGYCDTVDGEGTAQVPEKTLMSSDP